MGVPPGFVEARKGRPEDRGGATRGRGGGERLWARVSGGRREWTAAHALVVVFRHRDAWRATDGARSCANARRTVLGGACSRRARAEVRRRGPEARLTSGTMIWPKIAHAGAADEIVC